MMVWSRDIEDDNEWVIKLMRLSDFILEVDKKNLEGESWGSYKKFEDEKEDVWFAVNVVNSLVLSRMYFWILSKPLCYSGRVIALWNSVVILSHLCCPGQSTVLISCFTLIQHFWCWLAQIFIEQMAVKQINLF